MTGRSRKDVTLGLIGSIQPSMNPNAETSLADDSVAQLNMMSCMLTRLISNQQPKVVSWELTRPKTWVTDQWPPIVNDSFVDFTYTSESEAARLEWRKQSKKMFPTPQEAIAILEAARSTTVDNVGGTYELTEVILEWYQSNEPMMLPAVNTNLSKLPTVYQKGSLLHDSIQVLMTLTRDSV